MKLIIGAGGKTQDGWTSTEQSQLDLLREDDFVRILNGAVGLEAIVAEHVLEHLSEEEAKIAIGNCYKYLSVNGRLRIAVPDGFHPDKDYIEYVRPGGVGSGADTHQKLYTYRELGNLLMDAGFGVQYLEWWDETGYFNARLWNEKDGYIERCVANDPRNNDGKPHYTSLMLDGIKMDDDTRPNLKLAFDFVEQNDIHRLSPFNRKKTATLYELARLAPAGGVIVELGAYHGIGTAPLWYGTRDGHRCDMYSVDAYTTMRGWANEPYEPEDQVVWETNIKAAKIHPKLLRCDVHELSLHWTKSISLMVHDLGSKNRMPQDVMDWEDYVIIGGIIALRDIDDYSMGTEKAIKNLLATGKWGNRHNWEAFITSIERIA